MSRHPLFLLVAAALPVFAETTLDPIVVSVSSQVATLDQKTLEREPAKNSKALFNYTPGVNFADTGYNQLGDIEIRGMGGMGTLFGSSSNRVTMEVDGMEISQGFSFGHNMRNGRQYFDPADLKAVEIHKGPGANGISGNVRFRTKNPEDYLQENRNIGGEVRAGYSGDSNDYHAGGTIAARAGEYHGLSLSYTHRRFEELKNKGGLDVDGKKRTRRNPLDGRSNAVNGKWTFTPSEAHRFTTTLQHFDVKNDSLLRNSIGITSRSGATTTYAHNSQRNERNAVSFGHEMNLATAAFDRLDWQLSAQRTVSEGRNTSHSMLKGAKSVSHDNNDFKVNTITLKADAEKTLGSHELHYGFKLQYSDADLKSQRIGAQGVRNNQFFPKSEQWQTTLHAADRIRFGQSGVSLTPSLDISHISVDPQIDANRAAPGTKKYSKTALGGGLRLDWDINDQHQLSAAYTHATRLPAFGETNGQNYGHWLGRPNPNLKPETADGIELSWQSQGDLGQQRTTLFYNRYNDMISTQCSSNLDANDICEVLNEKGSSDIYGIEIDGRLELAVLGLPQGFAAEGALAWAKGENGAGEPIGKIDPLNGFVGLRYDHPEDTWGAAARLTFAAAKKAGDLPKKVELGDSPYNPLPGYGSVDLTGHYKPVKNMTISGGIYNLLDKQYARWNRARQHQGDTVPHSEAGRYIGVNFRYQF
ncbi:MAG: TonB-dependent hemoglobin/transferrin/lactoferrin family receptor [Cardiobacteriaceae bacterium]|nr:TonB-dependent hemoglobin/transferrin/lactoferrin family receptor [Cardiobacteriaceae bacterium]